MSLLLDYQYINQLSVRLDKFHWTRGSNLAMCRCPMCGDSQKKSNKTRFYIIAQDTGYGVYCHNCGYSNSFSRFLEEFDGFTYQQYRVEVFKEKGYNTREKRVEPVKPVYDLEKLKRLLGADKPILAQCSRVKDLDPMHPCRMYVEWRAIPAKHHDILWHSSNFKETILDFAPESADNLPEDSRLVIPFFDKEGILICLQGRSLDPKSEMRYITIKANEGIKKLYGAERLDLNRPVLVVEGPIDSLFLPNCVATADANLLAAEMGTVLIPDNQYRNKAVCNYIDKFIETGKRVVLFPETLPWKDINDMVMPTKGNMSQSELWRLIAENAYSGLKARMKWSNLKKA